MKEVTGQVKSWDGVSQRGMIEGDDGESYSFTAQQWKDVEEPEVDGGVLVICENGRDASHIEYLLIEHMPQMKVMVTSDERGTETISHSRFLGGPWRVRSDALEWMGVAKGIHEQISHLNIENIGELLRGEHQLISLRGSVIKYCYGFSIELYLKWILIEANIEYKTNHKLPQLVRKLPDLVLDELRNIYSDYRNRFHPEFRMLQAHVHGVEELTLDWSTFDKFIENLDRQKFIIGRYADPREYSIFQSSSAQRSQEMNSYMDSDDFFALAGKILSYKPDLGDYE